MKNNYSEKEIITKLNLQPGDNIIVPKSFLNLIQHHSIYLGFDIYGNHYICENVIGKGIILSSVSDFFKENPKITGIIKFKGNSIERKFAIHKALSKLGKPYSLINYNCEHFVNDVIHNDSKSSQVVAGVLGIGLLALLIGLAS